MEVGNMSFVKVVIKVFYCNTPKFRCSVKVLGFVGEHYYTNTIMKTEEPSSGEV